MIKCKDNEIRFVVPRHRSSNHSIRRPAIRNIFRWMVKSPEETRGLLHLEQRQIHLKEDETNFNSFKVSKINIKLKKEAIAYSQKVGILVWCAPWKRWQCHLQCWHVACQCTRDIVASLSARCRLIFCYAQSTETPFPDECHAISWISNIDCNCSFGWDCCHCHRCLYCCTPRSFVQYRRLADCGRISLLCWFRTLWAIDTRRWCLCSTSSDRL